MFGGGILGSILGGSLGYGLPDAFPAKDPFEHSATNAGIAYGLAFGMTLGMIIAMFYIRWKSWAIKHMIYEWRNGDDPEGNWIEWKPGCVHIAGTVLLIPIALFAVLAIWARGTVERVPLSAYSEKEGLAVRYFGFRAINVVGAYRVNERSKVYTFKYPRLYRDKGTSGCEEVIPWKQLVPMASDQKAVADDGARWELIYTKCEDTANR
jgi:hypothetical protein